MSRFAHHNPEDPEGAMEALVDRADFAKTQRREREQSGEPWPPGGRAEFRPSPRSEPGISVSLTSTQRTLGELIGGFRRTADCPQIVTRIGMRAWRWLCIPKGGATEQGQ